MVNVFPVKYSPQTQHMAPGAHASSPRKPGGTETFYFSALERRKKQQNLARSLDPRPVPSQLIPHSEITGFSFWLVGQLLYIAVYAALLKDQGLSHDGV